MAAEPARYPVKLMARLMGVPRSGYCVWVARPTPKDSLACLRAEIERTWLDSARHGQGGGCVAEGAIFHSDRGSQCTSKLVADWARENPVRLSVGRTGSCHDNAAAESFFATLLKNEMHSLRSWAARTEAKSAVVGYIEGCYNRRRPHSTIDYQIPAEKMEVFKRTEGCAAKLSLAA